MLLFSLKQVPSYKLQYLLHRCKSLCVCLSDRKPSRFPNLEVCYQYIRSAELKGSFMLTVATSRSLLH